MEIKTKITKGIRKYFYYICVSTLLIPIRVFAGWKLEVPIPPMKSGEEVSLDTYITNIYEFFFGAVGIIGVLMFMVGGFQYMISAGNRAVSSEAKRTMINAIIGIVLVIGAWVLLSEINKDLVDIEGKLDFK